LPSLSSKRTEFDFNLPVEYVVAKLYEYGYKVTHNKYSNTYNSCCPICHEGNSWGWKKRCFYIPENKNIFCHNCGSSLPPYQWVRAVSGMSHNELQRDLESDTYESLMVVLDAEKPKIRVPTLPEDSINLFDPIQVKYYEKDPTVKAATEYIEHRRLNTAINRPDALYISLKDRFSSNRLVIPFKDTGGKIVFYQTRKIFDWDDKPNYLSKLNSDKTLYGIDKIDERMDTVFLFEGPIDACFVKNGIGVAGINRGHFKLTVTQQEQMKSIQLFDKIWVLDSQWLDDTSRVKTQSLLEEGEKVFIWPKKWGKQFKDVNEMCVHHGLDQISPEFIKKNSICGENSILRFKMMFGNHNQ